MFPLQKPLRRAAAAARFLSAVGSAGKLHSAWLQHPSSAAAEYTQRCRRLPDKRMQQLLQSNRRTRLLLTASSASHKEKLRKHRPLAHGLRATAGERSDTTRTRGESST